MGVDEKAATIGERDRKKRFSATSSLDICYN